MAQGPAENLIEMSDEISAGNFGSSRLVRVAQTKPETNDMWHSRYLSL